MSIEEQIGMKIRNLRNQNGLTQEELADRTELTKGFISQLERGLTAPSVSTFLDIVECLGTNLSDFFHDEDDLQIVFPKGRRGRQQHHLADRNGSEQELRADSGAPPAGAVHAGRQTP